MLQKFGSEDGKIHLKKIGKKTITFKKPASKDKRK